MRTIKKCNFYPGCPPCFGKCGTDLAMFDVDTPDQKICKGCAKCRAERRKEIDNVKGNISQEICQRSCIPLEY